MIAQIVDWSVIGQLVLTGLAGGVGATAAFSLTIYGATRSGELRREGRGGAAAVNAALAVAGFAIVIAGLVYGFVIITEK